MKMRMLLAVFLCVLLLTACAAPGDSSTSEESKETQPVEGSPAEPAEAEATPESVQGLMAFELTSSAFEQGKTIPEKYSCKGEDISPPLAWGDPPADTKSFALIMDDPDAPVGTWDHWILFNIPAKMRGLEENLPSTGKNQNPDSIFVGNNSWKSADYGGPCPPSGTHRYFFKLYALDSTISLLPGATKKQLQDEMEGHILAEAELMGTFSK